MTSAGDSRPVCPTCQAPLRDIEVAMVSSQRDLAALSASAFRHRMLLFCGHRVELTVENDTVVFRPM
jgi:hypothetical protein